MRAGDRIEHAAVAPPEAIALLAGRGVSVVTQPGFIASRGDAYLRDVARRDLPYLYRCAGFLDAGHRAGRRAPTRRSAAPTRGRRCAPPSIGARRGRRVLADDERLTPERALALFTSPAEAPGGAPRRVRVGAPADLCLLERGWAEARTRLDAADVCATFCSGAPVFRT